MCESSAEMNTLLHSARFQSEIDDVLRDSVSVEEVTCIYENNIAIQALSECCPDAEEERKGMRWFTFEEYKLTLLENQCPVQRLYSRGQAGLEVSSEGASTTGLIVDLVVWFSEEFWVSTFQTGEETSSCSKVGDNDVLDYVKFEFAAG